MYSAEKELSFATLRNVVLFFWHQNKKIFSLCFLLLKILSGSPRENYRCPTFLSEWLGTVKLNHDDCCHCVARRIRFFCLCDRIAQIEFGSEVLTRACVFCGGVVLRIAKTQWMLQSWVYLNFRIFIGVKSITANAILYILPVWIWIKVEPRKIIPAAISILQTNNFGP